MRTVGTRVGQAFIYDRQQGLALTGADEPVDLYLKAIDQEKKLRAKAAGVKAKEDEAWTEAMKGLGDQEYWYQHQDEIQSELTEVYKMATDLRASGVANPMLGTDEGSRRFQEKYRAVQAMTQASRQLKEQYATFEEDLGKQGDKTKYTPESIKSVQAYFQIPLSKRMNNAIPQPMLMLQEPEWVQNEEDVAFVNELFSRDGFDRSALSDNDINDIASQTLSNPRTARNTMGIIQNMTPDQLQALTEEAQQQNMSPAALVRKYQLAPYMRGKTEEWDFMEAVKTFLPAVDTFRSENDEGTRAVTTKTARRKMERSVINFLADPERVKKAYQGGYFGEVDPSATMNDMMEAGRAALPSIFENQLNLGSSVDVTAQGGAGAGAEEQAAARIKWLEHMRSGDPQLLQEAAGYLMRGENDTGETTIELSTPKNSLWAGTKNPDYSIVDIRAVGTYKIDANAEPEPYVRESTIEIAKLSDQELLSLYDRQYNSFVKKKIPYTPQRTYKTPPGLLPSAPGTPSAPSAKPKGPSYLFE